MKKIYAIALLVLCISNLASARTYYVSITGNDSNTGTIDNPYLTINYVVDNLVQPGDTIFVRDGTYLLA
ncbi:MAG TPA: pectate lyase, partial [Paludibacter sp.]|nr:pectate lyase [Paludibacter sp.]